MPGFFYVLIGAALGVAILLLTRRLRASRAVLAGSWRLADARGRCLGMVAHELQTSGFASLALPGQAGSHGTLGEDGDDRPAVLS